MRGSNRGACRSCGAGVVWVLTEKAKRMPLDADPEQPGRALVVENGNHIVSKRGDGGEPDTVRYVKAGPGQLRSHFATCVNRDQHRKTS